MSDDKEEFEGTHFYETHCDDNTKQTSDRSAYVVTQYGTDETSKIGIALQLDATLTSLKQLKSRSTDLVGLLCPPAPIVA
jgi:hypothetical protein